MKQLEAVQYHLQEFADEPLTFSDIPEWLGKVIEKEVVYPEFRTEDYWYLVVDTLEGKMDVTPGDWIVKGTAGQLWVCSNDEFTRK